MVKYYRRYYRRYRRYRKSRRYKALSLKSTKTFTITIRRQFVFNYAFNANENLSDVKIFSFWPIPGMTCPLNPQAATEPDLNMANSTYFSRFSQIFGEFKVNSMKITITPTQGSTEPMSIYIVGDRKFIDNEDRPSAATIQGSMTAATYTFNSAAGCKAKKLLYAYNVTEKSTYVDCNVLNNTGAHAGLAFLPGFSTCAFKPSVSNAASALGCVALVSCSVTLRNPLY